MAGGSPQREGAEAFTAPDQVNHRRYEALRAFYVDGLTYAQAGARVGYTRWAMVNLVREYRAGKLELFAPPRRPGPPPGRRAGQGPRPRPGDRAAPGRVVDLRDLRAPGHRGHPAQPHQRRRDPRRGGIRAAAGSPRARGEHLAGDTRARHPAAPHRPARLRNLAAAASIPAGPGCCCWCPTWSASTCPAWSATRATPAPGSCPRCPGCCRC